MPPKRGTKTTTPANRRGKTPPKPKKKDPFDMNDEELAKLAQGEDEEGEVIDVEASEVEDSQPDESFPSGGKPELEAGTVFSWHDERGEKLKGVETLLLSEFPEDIVEEREGWKAQNGAKAMIAFVSWHHYCDRLDELCINWTYRINKIYFNQIPRWDNFKKQMVDELQATVHVTLEIFGTTRDAVGIGKDAKGAEHDALKRACTHFGLGRYMYTNEIRWENPEDQGGYSAPPNNQQQGNSAPPPRNNQQQGNQQQGKSFTIRDPDSPATPKQLSAVENIAVRQGYNDVNDYCAEWQFDWDNLTKGQAGQVISEAFKDKN